MDDEHDQKYPHARHPEVAEPEAPESQSAAAEEGRPSLARRAGEAVGAALIWIGERLQGEPAEVATPPAR
jgi:hypothetical protein